MTIENDQLPNETTRVFCNRGGNHEIADVELNTFILISLEEAADLLRIGQTCNENDPSHPRISLHAVALSRVQEALDAFKAIAKKTAKQ